MEFTKTRSVQSAGGGLCSLLSALCSLLSARCSLLSAHCSLLSALCSLLAAPCPLLPAPCSLLTALTQTTRDGPVARRCNFCWRVGRTDLHHRSFCTDLFARRRRLSRLAGLPLENINLSTILSPTLPLKSLFQHNKCVNVCHNSNRK